MTTTLRGADHTHATLAADERASRRARRMVYESCLLTKVPSEVVDDAMGLAAGLVSDIVSQASGPLRLEVFTTHDEVTVRVRDAVGNESSAHTGPGPN